jgi:hypothetical protein
MPVIAARLQDLGAEPNPKSVEQFAALYRNEIQKWKAIVKQADIAPVD